MENKPITATEVEEEIKKLREEIHKSLEPFLNPIISKCVEVLVMNGHITDKEIEEIANYEISKKG